MRLHEKIVVVTGASRGIGRAVATAFGHEGAVVVCVATTQENADSTAIGIEGAVGFGCDVSDAGAVETLFSRIEKEVGTPYALVNNAGVTRDALMIRMKDEDWDRVLAVNLKGAFLCTRAVAKPMMKAREGRIVNVSSVVGVSGAAGQANYAASKAGLIGLTKATAKELGGRGITCNAVAPGFIETDMTSGLTPEFREHVEKTSALGRLGTPEDVAAAILFFCAPESAYITGQVLSVDGGLPL
ncbi:MAG: 3-oxoacyl-[acyl-carrier-protein] reductase [Fimbriimonadaceae bacterium]|nr:3-oxoacyl-[acyl-carrier-protein] reductase [Fimbriimonadaceae bacterium]QYK55936.1 MAG: 3-oxoacyl-[acyl-carrier-protein] reductase [Fimbriimonadaceae bacterium]